MQRQIGAQKNNLRIDDARSAAELIAARLDTRNQIINSTHSSARDNNCESAEEAVESIDHANCSAFTIWRFNTRQPILSIKQRRGHRLYFTGVVPQTNSGESKRRRAMLDHARIVGNVESRANDILVSSSRARARARANLYLNRYRNSFSYYLCRLYAFTGYHAHLWASRYCEDIKNL